MTPNYLKALSKAGGFWLKAYFLFPQPEVRCYFGSSWEQEATGSSTNHCTMNVGGITLCLFMIDLGTVTNAAVFVHSANHMLMERL